VAYLIPDCNHTAVIISAICITCIYFNNEIIKVTILSYVERMFIIGTIVAYFGDLSNTHNLKVVGHIPTGRVCNP